MAADEMRAHATLSAAKPPLAISSGNTSESRAYQTSYISNLARSKYARRRLDPLEIDVINSGGLLENPATSKQSHKRNQR